MYRSQHYRLQDCTISLRPHAANELLVKMDSLVLFKGFGRCAVTVATHECLNGSPQPSVKTDRAVEEKMQKKQPKEKQEIRRQFQICGQVT